MFDFFFLGVTSFSLLTSKTPPMIDGVEKFQAGQVGIEPTTPAFGERCSAKLSYWPMHVGRQVFLSVACPHHLFYLTVQRMFSASWTIFFQLHPAGIISTVFLSRIIPLLAFCTFQGNNRSDTFLFCHVYFTMVAPSPGTTMSSFL
jgi:hypothetical protein